MFSIFQPTVYLVNFRFNLNSLIISPTSFHWNIHLVELKNNANKYSEFCIPIVT